MAVPADFGERMLVKATEALETLQRIDASKPLSPSAYLSISDATSLIMPGFPGLESGWVRGDDGKLHIACLTPMPGCTGAMVEWWFRFCNDSTKYRWWHPVDHIEGTWSEGFLSVPLAERMPGHHVGQSHIVKELIDGECNSLHIDFKPPEEYLDTSLFDSAGVTACLCARVNVFDKVAGDVAVGHLCHVVQEKDGKCEMRSKFWLGDIHKSAAGFPPRQIVNFIGNTRIGRILRGPDKLAKGILRQCNEEMTCLAAILPDVHAVHNSTDGA